MVHPATSVERGSRVLLLIEGKEVRVEEFMPDLALAFLLVFGWPVLAVALAFAMAEVSTREDERGSNRASSQEAATETSSRVSKSAPPRVSKRPTREVRRVSKKGTATGSRDSSMQPGRINMQGVDNSDQASR